MNASLHVLEGHTNCVQSLAFSQDGTRLCSGAADGTIRLWDPARGTLLQILENPSGDVQSVAFSPGGDRIASGSADGSISLWRISEPNPIWTSREHADWVKQVVFSPDGSVLASCSADDTVKLWRFSDGSLLNTKSSPALPGGLFFSADGARITITNTHGMFTFSAAGDEILHEIRWQLFASGVAFSPDRSRMASRFFVNFAVLWELLPDMRALQGKLEGHEGIIFSIGISPDGSVLATGSKDTTVRIWDVAYGLPLHTFRGHRDTIFSLAFAPDGQTLASGSDDATVRIWRLNA